MKRTVLKTKGTFDGKENKVTHVRLTKAICDDPKNAHLNLKAGYARVNPPADCPPDTSEGYYQESGGNCIFVKYS